MRKPLSMALSAPASGRRMAAAYLWLLRARRLMRSARGSEWISGGQGRDRASSPELAPAGEDRRLIKERVAAISRASRYPVPWAFCLQRSLALREWLARDGVLAEVRYGVRRRDGKLEAHAWVVYDGKIINDSVRHVSTFAPLQSFDEYRRMSSKGAVKAVSATDNSSGNSGKAI